MSIFLFFKIYVCFFLKAVKNCSPSPLYPPPPCSLPRSRTPKLSQLIKKVHCYVVKGQWFMTGPYHFEVSVILIQGGISLTFFFGCSRSSLLHISICFPWLFFILFFLTFVVSPKLSRIFFPIMPFPQ